MCAWSSLSFLLVYAFFVSVSSSVWCMIHGRSLCLCCASLSYWLVFWILYGFESSSFCPLGVFFYLCSAFCFVFEQSEKTNLFKLPKGNFFLTYCNYYSVVVVGGCCCWLMLWFVSSVTHRHSRSGMWFLLVPPLLFDRWFLLLLFMVGVACVVVSCCCCLLFVGVDWCWCCWLLLGANDQQRHSYHLTCQAFSHVDTVVRKLDRCLIFLHC